MEKQAGGFGADGRIGVGGERLEQRVGGTRAEEDQQFDGAQAMGDRAVLVLGDGDQFSVPFWAEGLLDRGDSARAQSASIWGWLRADSSVAPADR